MPVITHGTVTVTIPDTLVIPANAGNLTPQEVLKIPKARLGIGLACEQAASALEKTTNFAAGAITPHGLRRKGHMAETIDEVIASVEVVLAKLKQANLLLDADAWEELRQLNELVKAQTKFRPELGDHFAPLIEFMGRRRPAASPPAASPNPPEGSA